MAGRRRYVGRIVSAAVVVVLVAAACGSSARPDRTTARGVPRALASVWAAQASQIAETARAGDGCSAHQLANTLRDEIVAKQAELPVRLSSPLLMGVNALADRIVCEVPPQTVTVSDKKPPPHEPKPKPPPKPPPPKHHPKHDDNHQGSHG